MKPPLFHLYYSGMDVVDINEEWRRELTGTRICPACGEYTLPGHHPVELVVNQEIPKNVDMFSGQTVWPSIMSNKLRSILGTYGDRFLNFGDIFLAGVAKPMQTHCAFTGKWPWISVRSELPILMDGKPVLGADRVCPVCAAIFSAGRGKRYVTNKDLRNHEILCTQFGGLLLNEQVMKLFTGTKLRAVRVEKIEVWETRD